MHATVFVKVNAKVDEKIAPLILALSQLPGVVTLCSCQGDPGGTAHVVFTVNDDWKQEGEFLCRLSEELGRLPDVCDIAKPELSLKWYAGASTPGACLRLPHEGIDTVAAAIYKVAERFQGDVVP
jgi:hypothetical protein